MCGRGPTPSFAYRLMFSLCIWSFHSCSLLELRGDVFGRWPISFSLLLMNTLLIKQNEFWRETILTYLSGAQMGWISELKNAKKSRDIATLRNVSNNAKYPCSESKNLLDRFVSFNDDINIYKMIHNDDRLYRHCMTLL